MRGCGQKNKREYEMGGKVQSDNGSKSQSFDPVCSHVPTSIHIIQCSQTCHEPTHKQGWRIHKVLEQCFSIWNQDAKVLHDTLSECQSGLWCSLWINNRQDLYSIQLLFYVYYLRHLHNTLIVWQSGLDAPCGLTTARIYTQSTTCFQLLFHVYTI